MKNPEPNMVMQSFFYIFIAILFLFGCQKPHKKEGVGEKNILFILNWADYVPGIIIEEFEKETGIHVVYDVFDSAEALEAKLLMHAPYDVVFPPAWPVYARLISLDVFQPLNKKLMPYADGFDPKIIEKFKILDKNLTYGVPYLWGTTGIGFDKNALKNRGENLSFDSWSLLFDPSIAAKLAPGRIALLDSPTDVLQAALLYLGHCPCTNNFALWDEAVQCVMRVRPYIFSFEGSKQIENLSSGQNEIIQGFSTYVNMARHKENKSKDIHFVIPKEGAMVWFDMMAIPKNAPHPMNAHKFINFILRPDVIARISTLTRAANAIPSSYAQIEASLLHNKTVFPDAQTLERIQPDFLPSPALLRYLSRQWLKIKMGFFEK